MRSGRGKTTTASPSPGLARRSWHDYCYFPPVLVEYHYHANFMANGCMDRLVLAWLWVGKTGGPISPLPRAWRFFMRALLVGLSGLMSAVCVAQTGQVGAFRYSVADGSVTITGFAGNVSEVVIPSTIEGLPVKAIGYGAFLRNGYIRRLTIPEGVTHISDSAFSECGSLSIVILPDSVTHIGNRAFSECNALTRLKLPNSLIQIGNSAFSYCGHIPQVSVPDSVVSIGDYAFRNCATMTNLTFGCGVQSIGDYAFSECHTLGQLAVPDNVTRLGDEAFALCISLTNANLGAGLASLGRNPFRYCRYLTNIEVAAANPNLASVEGVLVDKKRSALISYPMGSKQTAYTVPAGISVIGTNAFDLSGLTQATLPDSVTAIEDGAFYYCRRLRGITLGKNVASIGQYTFCGCTNLTYINLPNSLTNLEDWVFWSCTHLASLIIPRHVTRIGDYAFADCPGLQGLYFLGNAPTVGDDIHTGNPHLRIYYLNDAAGWHSTFASHPTEPWKLQFMKTYDQAGVRSNQFGLTVYGQAGKQVVMDACEDAINPDWHPVATNILTEGSAEFLDPQWSQFPQRFYRLRAP